MYGIVRKLPAYVTRKRKRKKARHLIFFMRLVSDTKRVGSPSEKEEEKKEKGSGRSAKEKDRAEKNGQDGIKPPGTRKRRDGKMSKKKLKKKKLGKSTEGEIANLSFGRGGLVWCLTSAKLGRQPLEKYTGRERERFHFTSDHGLQERWSAVW